MHDLILAESDGKPFSYRSLGWAVARIHDDGEQSARTAQGKGPTIRIGLTGFQTNLFGATAESNLKLFEPSPNVALANLRPQKLCATCGRLEYHRGHETWYAIALWRGSRKHMNTALADRVMTSIAVGNLSNPKLPTGCKCTQIACKQRNSGPENISLLMTVRVVKPQVHVCDSGPIFIRRDDNADQESRKRRDRFFAALSRN